MALKRAARKIMMPAVLLGIVGVIMLLGGCSGGHTAAETSDSLQGEHLDSLQWEHKQLICIFQKIVLTLHCTPCPSSYRGQF